MAKWQDTLPPDAPKPKSGERRGHYLLRILREGQERRQQALIDAIEARRDGPKQPNVTGD